ncbi:hypothetical protein PVL29_010119 [Vitis rotundifolia]|uniref:FAS1 domain-containing protein n=1 Tax=Vitis rotundifolia TaxID=103349 RepID=A0AA39DSG8_VITRO|nr:hypothetical protein PVL29_010119 [Vitis rotundifolia]
MMKQLLSPTLLLLIFFLLCATTSGQSSAPATAPSGPTTVSGQSSPPAPATSGPSGPPDIISVLQKASNSQVDVLINTQLKKSNQGFTVFAPNDSAFSDLKTGTLNSFTDQQKAALTKYHAGENTVEFPLNVVGNGTHANMTTGLVNTTVDSTVYSDGQLAVYEIPQVLLSQGILSPQAPAPAPLAPKPKKAAPLNALAPTRSTTVSVDSSDATGLPHYAPTVVSIGVAVLAQCPYPYELSVRLMDDDVLIFRA